MALLKPILRKLLKHPRSVAVVDDQRSFSHAAVVGAAAHVAKEIAKRTDKPRVGIMLPTGGGFPIALLACWMAGRVPVPLNYLLERDDLHHVFEDSGVDLLLTAGKLLDHVREHTAADAIPEGLDLLTLETMSVQGRPPAGGALPRPGLRHREGCRARRRGPRRAALHLGHLREAQGRRAHPPQPGAQRQRLHRARRPERADDLPGRAPAVPQLRAHRAHAGAAVDGAPGPSTPPASCRAGWWS